MLLLQILACLLLNHMSCDTCRQGAAGRLASELQPLASCATPGLNNLQKGLKRFFHFEDSCRKHAHLRG
jgi:hypothetical protein